MKMMVHLFILSRELTKKTGLSLAREILFSYVDEVNSKIDGQVKFTGKKRRLSYN